MTRFKRVLLCLCSLLILSGCERSASEQQGMALLIEGKASHNEQRALPVGSEMILRLEDISALPDSPAILAEKVIRLDSQQKPFRFQLRVFRDQLENNTSYALRVLITSANGKRWTAENLYRIDPQLSHINLGQISLKPQLNGAPNTNALFVCGSRTIKTHFGRQSLQLQLNDDVYHLHQVATASGAQYQSKGGQVVFWNKGTQAHLTMAGFEWPTCTKVSEDTLALFPFQAQGNEPGWRLTAHFDQVKLDWNYGQQHLLMPYPLLDLTHSGFVLHSKADARLLRVNVLNSLCRDSMSGRPYPQHVKVLFGDLHLSGCGGDSQSLLTGDEWVVEDINRQGIIDASRITLQFDTSGRLHGRASCNQYTTTYELTEQIDIGQAITTRKACAPALMNQEQRFLSLLAQIVLIDFDQKGALLLSTADGSTLTARR